MRSKILVAWIASVYLGITGCSSNDDLINNAAGIGHAEEAENGSSSTDAGEVNKLLASGNPQACSSKPVKDSIVGKSFPIIDDMPSRSWEKITEDVNVEITNTTVEDINRDTSEMRCAATLVVSTKEVRNEIPITFSLSRNLDNPDDFLIGMNFQRVRNFIYYGGKLQDRVFEWRKLNADTVDESYQNNSQGDGNLFNSVES